MPVLAKRLPFLALPFLLVTLLKPAADAAGPEKKAPRLDLQGDPLPPGAVARLGSQRFRVPSKEFLAVAFAPDGKALAGLDTDGRLTLWDLASGRVLHAEKGKRKSIGKKQSRGGPHALLAFSPDGRQLVVGMNWGDYCRPLCLWDRATGRDFHHFVGAEEGFVAAAVARDFKTLAASARGKPLLLWDLNRGAPRRQWKVPGGEPESVALSPDGKVLATGGPDSVVRLWDTASGKEVLSLKGHKGPVTGLAFSPDGKTLASRDESRLIFLWDCGSGKEIRRWRSAPDDPRSVALRLAGLTFSPDGKTLAVCEGGWTIDLWDPASGKLRHRLRGNCGPACTFSPDGRLLATANRKISLLDTRTGLPLYGAHQEGIRGAAFSPDGRTAFTLEFGRLSRWDARTGRLLGVLPLRLPALSGDGRLVAEVAGGKNDRIDLRETATGKTLRTIRPGKWPQPRQFSADGKLLGVVLSGNQEQALAVFDTATGEELHRLGKYPHFLASQSFSADGRTVAALPPGGGDGINPLVATYFDCRLWRLPGGYLERNVKLPDPRAVVLSPDGRLLASNNWGRLVTVVEVASGRPVRSWSVSGSLVDQLVFSPGGRLLAVSESPDVQVWDVESGKLLRRFSGHLPGWVNTLAFSPDGTRLLSGSDTDGTALIWDVSGLSPRPAAVELKAERLRARWAALADPDPSVARRALAELARAPAGAAKFIAERLRERPKEALARDAARIDKLIAELGDAKYAVREKASAELSQAPEAAPTLQKQLAGKGVSLEVRRRIERVLAELRRGRAELAAGTLRWLRAIEVLERVATPEAREVLTTLARGSGPVGAEAAASLERLRKRR
jgi:WD40 repeat protein